jgi:hypothetical protein
MSDEGKATHEDAQLILRLYELRREEKLRAARDWFGGTFFPASVEDVKAIWFDFTSPNNAYYRMVTSYWDMAASFVARGALDGRLFVESGTEMVLVWAKLEDFITELRQESGLSDYLSNIEKVVSEVPLAQARLKWLRERIRQRREMLAKSARE